MPYAAHDQTAWGSEAQSPVTSGTPPDGDRSEQIDQFTTVVRGRWHRNTSCKSRDQLNFACRHCHLPDTSMAMDDQTLINAAYNYHEKPA